MEKRQWYQLGCLISCDCCFQEKPRKTCTENESNKGRSMYACGNYPVLLVPKRGAFWQTSKIANITMTHFTTKQRLLRTRETSSLPNIFFMTRNLFSKEFQHAFEKSTAKSLSKPTASAPPGQLFTKSWI